jgi:GAF domain-containing protein
MAATHSTQPAQLLGLARALEAATGDWSTRPEFESLTNFLAQVRQALGMEVAFVSRFHAGSRIVEAADASDQVQNPLRAGDADEVDNTYCQLILKGQLDPVIRDVDAHPQAAQLDITQRLKIRSYISATIVLASGGVFGTLCCYSGQARSDLQAIDAAALQAVADAIAADIDRHGRLTERIWQWGGQPGQDRLDR